MSHHRNDGCFVFSVIAILWCLLCGGWLMSSVEWWAFKALISVLTLCICVLIYIGAAMYALAINYAPTTYDRETVSAVRARW